MKFSWKVFFSTIIISVITFSLGGYILISSLFNSSFNREIDIAREENKMLRYSFETAMLTIPDDSNITNETIDSISLSVLKSFGSGEVKIRVSDDTYTPLYELGSEIFDTRLLHKIHNSVRGYEIINSLGGFYIQTACLINANDKIFYLESFRDITSVFEERDEQYRVFQKLMIALILMNGTVIYLLSLWLSRPISRLSKATREIANGKFDNRIRIKSEDEFGKLAADFNSMAENLEKKIHALEDAARRQEDFVGSFSHELKTPLTSIIGYADMLRSKKLSEETSFIAANYIYQEGKRLESLSLKMLELIVMQKSDFGFKKISTVQLFEEIIGLKMPDLNSKQITFEASADDHELDIEPDLFKSLIFNLLDNARKAISENGKISLTGKIEPGGYSITIQDSGKGIASADLPKITEAFYMVEKSRSKANGGSGLGLAICAEIVKLHHGELLFDSTPGVGTAVRVILYDAED